MSPDGSPLRRGVSWIGAAILAASHAYGCAGSMRSPAAPGDSAAGPFHVVAEGPCARLSVARMGERTMLVFGDTGYELADWSPGDELAAAQSFIELHGGQVLRNLTLLEGLPLNDGGYVPGDLQLGGALPNDGWLLRTTTRYAQRGVGALFDRELHAYLWRGDRWALHGSPEVVRLPRAAQALPPLPVDTLCSPFGPHMRFLRTASFVLERTSDVWIAGRCQDDAHINTRPTRIRIAHGAPGARAWQVADAPASAQLDAIVNMGLYARSPDDVWLSAWEPFKPIDRRVPYLVRFDGTTWSVQHPPMTTGVTSVAGLDDGTVWAAAGYELWRRDPAGRWARVTLPPLPHSTGYAENRVRVVRVQAFGPADVWVEGAFRVALKGSKGDPKEPVRASVLYRNSATPSLIYCDARKPVDQALTVVPVEQ